MLGLRSGNASTIDLNDLDENEDEYKALDEYEHSNEDEHQMPRGETPEAIETMNNDHWKI